MQIRTLAWTLAVSVLTVTISSAQAPQRDRANTIYRELPLTFEPNRGQTGSQVKFLSRGIGYTAFLTTGGMVLSLRPPADAAASSSPEERAATMQLTLVSAAKSPTLTGEDPQPGRVNYFFGNDPAKWLTSVPTYARVRYKNVYPGIDLVYYGNHRQLEYDFEIQPGSDPSKIQFQIQGANSVGLDPKGNLRLRLGNKEIHFQSPVVYQESNGMRTTVGGEYVMTDSTHVAFQIAHYDSSKPLVIDPVLLYSTYLGGSGTDKATGIAVDSAGSVYVTGYTNSLDFARTKLGPLAENANHVFVAKLDPTGANLIYADYIGGNSEDCGVTLALNSANEVYVTGTTASSNFPVVKAYQSQQPGPHAGFLTRISADGSSLLYSTYLGGGTFDRPTSIAIDSLGQVHMAGYTESQNFPTVNAYQSMAPANLGGVYGVYGFLSKFSADGSSLIYSTYWGGNSVVAQPCWSNPCWPAPYNAVTALAVDASGNAYVAGTTNTDNFPVTPRAFLTANNTQQAAKIGFVSKFDSAGGLDYSTYLYGSGDSPVEIVAIAVDDMGSAYVAGNADRDGTFPITTAGICDPRVYGSRCSNGFITKFDPTGTTLLYSTFLGLFNCVKPQAIVLDAAGNTYVLASTSKTSFETDNPVQPYAGNHGLLLVEIDRTATTQLFSTYVGSGQNDLAGGMALDANGSIYVAGSTDFADSRVTKAADRSYLGSNTDAFVVKIGRRPTPEISVSGISLSPESLTFPNTKVGVSSAAQTVTLTNLDNSGLDIANIQISGDYAQTNNCPATLAAQVSCTFNITFTPAASGSRNGTLVISDSAAGSPQSVPLSGTGVDFSLTGAPVSATVHAGAAATYTLTVAPVGGPFTDSITLACTEAASDSNCGLSSASVTPGSTSATVTLTITTTASSAAVAQLLLARRRPFLAVWMPLQGLGLFGLMVVGSKGRQKKAIATAVLLAALLLLSACAGGTGVAPSGTPPGTYQITVKGASGALQHSLLLTLTVQ